MKKKTRFAMICGVVGVASSLVACGPMGEQSSSVDRTSSAFQATAINSLNKAVSRTQAQPSLTPWAKEMPNNLRKAPDKSILPLGLWKGQMTLENKAIVDFSLRVNFTGKQAFLPRRPVRRAQPTGWSLFRQAHACGPYGGFVYQQSIRGQFAMQVYRGSGNNSSTFEGEGYIRSYDSYKSFNLSLTSKDGQVVSAYFTRNNPTAALVLRGNLYQRKQTERGIRSLPVGQLQARRNQ